jgi:predicted permease
MSLVVLMGTVVLGTSLARLLTADPGFVTRNIVLVSVDASLARTEKLDVPRALRQVADNVRAQPGVANVSLGDPPLGSVRTSTRLSTSDGRVDAMPTLYRSVAPDYFDTLGIPIIRGRGFRWDAADTQGAIVVNEALASRLWPGRDPVGEDVRMEGETTGRRVIGVARTVPYNDLWETPQPFVYVPFFRRPTAMATFIVRTNGPLDSLEGLFQREVGIASRQFAIVQVETIEERMSSQLSRQRLAAAVFATLGTIAIVLVTVGMFGLLSFVVQQQTRDIGIRLALGAQRRALALDILGQATLLTSAGIAIGAGIWWQVSDAFEPEVHGISALDPRVMVFVASLLMFVVLLAAFLPAWAASRVDPLVALRAE